MKTAFAIWGGIHFFLMMFGNVNIIDYHLCVADAGKCKCTMEVKQ